MLTVRGSNIAARARTKRRRTTKSLACTACRDSLGAWREAHERVRIMPKVNDLVSDGRHDLKNAIYKQGGPKRVAASLGRTTVLTVPERLRASLEYLRTELKPYLQPSSEQGELRLPLMKQLAEEGRADLVKAIREAGGAVDVARSFANKGKRVVPLRVTRGRWHDEEFAAAELKAFVRATIGCDNELRLPTQRELVEQRAWGLRYAMRKHGATRLAELIGADETTVRRRGRPRKQK